MSETKEVVYMGDDSLQGTLAEVQEAVSGATSNMYRWPWILQSTIA